jgi:hypothetical protein
MGNGIPNARGRAHAQGPSDGPGFPAVPIPFLWAATLDQEGRSGGPGAQGPGDIEGCPIPRRKRSVRKQADRQPGQEHQGSIRQEGEKGRPIAVIDFETDPFERDVTPRAFACGFTDGQLTETKWDHWSEETVVRWGIEKCSKFPGIVYAHNGGKFDFPGYIMKYAQGLMFGESVLFIGSRVVSMRLGECELRDSYAIIPAPLREHDKGKIHYKRMAFGQRRKHKPEIVRYLRRDCLSLWTLCRRFVDEHGSRVLTAAGGAMQAVRASGVKIGKMTETKDTLFRQWYFGGRCQAFLPGEHRGRFTVYDINSAYPHAMLSNHALGTDFKYIPRPDASKIRPTDFLCVRVLKTRGEFPERTKRGLDYPAMGERVLYVTGWEYLAARLLPGFECEIIFVYRCKRLGNFSAFVMAQWHKKQEAEDGGDKAGRLIPKLIMNAASGKLAQRPDRWREFVIVNPNDCIPKDSPWREEYVDDGSEFAIWSKATDKPKRYLNVATAASITGFVRARMLVEIRTTAPFYCDTDSVIVKSSRKVKTGKTLGDWKKEVEGDWLLIAGKKLYGLRVLRKYAPTYRKAIARGFQWWKGRAWKIVAKGCKLTPHQLWRITNGEEVFYGNVAPTFSLRSDVKFWTRGIKRTSDPVRVPYREPEEEQTEQLDL